LVGWVGLGFFGLFGFCFCSGCVLTFKIIMAFQLNNSFICIASVSGQFIYHLFR